MKIVNAARRWVTDHAFPLLWLLFVGGTGLITATVDRFDVRMVAVEMGSLTLIWAYSWLDGLAPHECCCGGNESAKTETVRARVFKVYLDSIAQYGTDSTVTATLAELYGDVAEIVWPPVGKLVPSDDESVRHGV